MLVAANVASRERERDEERATEVLPCEEDGFPRSQDHTRIHLVGFQVMHLCPNHQWTSYYSWFGPLCAMRMVMEIGNDIQLVHPITYQVFVNMSAFF